MLLFKVRQEVKKNKIIKYSHLLDQFFLLSNLQINMGNFPIRPQVIRKNLLT